MKKLILAMACALGSTQASAALVTFEFTGVINIFLETSQATGKTRATVGTSITPGALYTGDTFSGSFSYDTAATRSQWGGPFDQSQLAIPAAAINFGAFEIRSQAGMPTAEVYRGFADSLTIMPSFAADTHVSFEFRLNGPYGGFLTDQGLPGQLSLDSIYQPNVVATWTNGGQGDSVQVLGILTSLNQVTPVPEPSTYAMLAAGMALVGVAARRRRRRMAA